MRGHIIENLKKENFGGEELGVIQALLPWDSAMKLQLK